MSLDWSALAAESHPEFARALLRATRLGLTNLDPWEIFVTEADVQERSDDLNRRYPVRKVLCFAERVDTDDVACLVQTPSENERSGSIIIVHDFANEGWEVADAFPDFWEWFRSAVDDMITLSREFGDRDGGGEAATR